MESVQRLILPKTASAQTPAQGKPKPAATQAPRADIPRLRAPDRPALSNWSLTATAVDRAQDSERRAARFAVEVHKKWSISFACISFVIVGIVMALRFPRGGIGLVIGGALLVFSVHYVGLTTGESLADRGHVSPWLAMWAPNIVLTVLGTLGLIRVSRESGSTRGGDFQEVVEGVRHLFRRMSRRA
jgi:lipopolysaccharide export system permease protein